MYYKRISDLQPLGKPVPTDTSPWNNVKPITGLINISKSEYSVDSGSKIISYDKPSVKVAHEINATNLNPLLDELIFAFRRELWQTLTSDSVTYITAKYVSNANVESSGDFQDDTEPTSEYYPKAIWFEVDIAKNSSNVPVDIVNDSSSISKYQTKRVNAFNLCCSTTETNTSDSSYTPTSSVTNLTQDYIQVENCLDITNSIVSFISANRFDIVNFTTDYINVGNEMSVSELSSNAISAKHSRNINNLHGNYFYYPNTNIQSDTELSVSHIYGQIGTFASVNANELSATNIKTNDLFIKNPDGYKYFNEGVETSALVGNSGIGEYFVCSPDISVGELVRVGSSTSHSSIEMIRAGDISAVHGIVVDEKDPSSLPGIILNKKLRDEYPNDIRDSNNNLLAKIRLIQLFGNVNARIRDPIGLHQMNNIYDEISNPMGIHHHPGWEDDGCCDCSGDVGIGTPLYLSKIPPGVFCISADITETSSYIDEIAFISSPTDNGSLITDRNFGNNVDAAVKEGRQTNVYFMMNL